MIDLREGLSADGQSTFKNDLLLYGAIGLMCINFLVYLGVDVFPQISTNTLNDGYSVSEGASTDLTNAVMIQDSGPKMSQASTLPLPVKSQSEVTSWAAMVAVQLFSVNFFRYNQQVMEMRPFFTDSGWSAMTNALSSSGWVDTLINSKLSSTAVLSGTPIVTKHGMLDGAYTWVVNFPLLVTYESASETRKEKRVFTLTVKRIEADYEKGQAGIAIDSFRTVKGGNA